MKENTSNKNLNSVAVQEENFLDWDEVLKKFQANFGNDIYESWIKNIKLKKEFNHYVVLSAPTRFVRDWIVSRYLDKLLDIIKKFKISIQRVEFLIEAREAKFEKPDYGNNAQVSFIENSLSISICSDTKLKPKELNAKGSSESK